MLVQEAARLLERFGAETRIFHPAGLPLPDDAPDSHPKVRELRDLMQWSEGQVWCSPERHGSMSAVFKAQIDWVPLAMGALRPTQGKTLAIMQVSGGSQSFNALNQMRVLGRWMRMLTIPNQSSVAKAYLEFDEAGRMKPSAYYDRVVDVMEELIKFTLLVRGRADYGRPLFGTQGVGRSAVPSRQSTLNLTSVSRPRVPSLRHPRCTRLCRSADLHAVSRQQGQRP